MAFKHIVSRDNLIFKNLKKLSDNARERKKQGKTLLDGVHLIESYQTVFGEVECLIIPEGKSSAEATALIQGFDDSKTIMLPTLMFAELTPVASSTGVLALVATPALTPPTQVDFALLIEDVQDPGNLGSILRTAAAAGVEVAYLSQSCTDAWSPKCLRGGQGAQFLLPLVESVAVIETLQTFTGNTYATVMNGASLYEADLTGPTLFVVGNEGAGIKPETMQACSHHMTIPMMQSARGGIESLNAGAATAVVLFERTRQRLAKK